MENRFGLKDLLLVALMVCVIIVQFLQMKQRDLQQKRVDAIAQNLEAQNTQIANLIRTIAADRAVGVIATGGRRLEFFEEICSFANCPARSGWTTFTK